ncbi:Protein FORGETTER [Trichinella spiralis]
MGQSILRKRRKLVRICDMNFVVCFRKGIRLIFRNRVTETKSSALISLWGWRSTQSRGTHSLEPGCPEIGILVSIKRRLFHGVRSALVGKSAKRIRNFGTRIGSKGWADRAEVSSVQCMLGLVVLRTCSLATGCSAGRVYSSLKQSWPTDRHVQNLSCAAVRFRVQTVSVGIQQPT